MRRPEMVNAALLALNWLCRLQRSEQGYFSPIGNKGFFRRGQERARFDQQPIEAYSMVSACLEAFRVTSDRQWKLEAIRAFEWFRGRNEVGLAVYDSATGGCRDGLTPDGLNWNQGAE